MTTTPEEPPKTVESLLDKIIDGTKNIMHYIRNRFLWTWLAIAVLALLTGFALVLATKTAETNLKQTDDIARLAKANAQVADTTATAAKQQSDETVAYLRGEQGIPGVPGANGEDGTPGQPSSIPGPAGPAGEAGPSGSAGANGTAGSTGPMGLSGASGPLGPVGPAGAAGSNGIDGTVGAEGPQGPKGDKGNQGDTGDVGPQGPAGPPGPAGPTGASTVNTITVAAASANDTTPQKNVAATCTSGRISGGGYAILPATAEIVPTTTSTVGNGWQVTANASSSLPAGTNWQVLAFAVCVV